MGLAFKLALHNRVSFLHSTEMMSRGSDYRPRNPDTATTEAYSDPGAELSESFDSVDSLYRNFLINFMCILCRGAPAYDQAAQEAVAWAAGDMSGLVSWILQPDGNQKMSHVAAFCTTCRSFFHAGCILAFGSMYSISQLAELMLMKMEGHVPVSFLCQNCHNNM